MVGKRVLPEALWMQKQDARFHVIEVPEEERVRHLCEIYGGFPPGELEACVDAIRSRLGGGRTKAAIEAIHGGDFAAACRIILSYYDRTYQNCLTAHPSGNVIRHHFQKLDPPAIAAALIASTRALS